MAGESKLSFESASSALTGTHAYLLTILSVIASSSSRPSSTNGFASACDCASISVALRSISCILSLLIESTEPRSSPSSSPAMALH